ncbi:MAG TPA: YhbY family RNA-binding protein [Candidatus Nanoarchaeia archaeon]|nr:YhbY family RNA-binding protein [Candidatus Nanoarchaeia archaeon]
MNKKELRSKAKTMTATMNIGKEGLTETVIEEIKKQLRQKKLIKIKMMQSLAQDKNKDDVAAELVEKTDAVLIDRIGFVIVLAIKSAVSE